MARKTENRDYADDRWVSCSVYEGGVVAHTRHRVRKGRVTTKCGATASSPDVWVPNYSKPKCITCAGSATESDWLAER